jgi:hypothetical protein
MAMEQFFVEAGRRGGKKAMAKLTKAERSELGRKGATARWKKAAKKKKDASK